MYMYNEFLNIPHEKVFNKDWEKNHEIPCYLGDISEMCQLHNKTFDIVWPLVSFLVCPSLSHVTLVTLAFRRCGLQLSGFCWCLAAPRWVGPLRWEIAGVEKTSAQDVCNKLSKQHGDQKIKEKAGCYESCPFMMVYLLGNPWKSQWQAILGEVCCGTSALVYCTSNFEDKGVMGLHSHSCYPSWDVGFSTAPVPFGWNSCKYCRRRPRVLDIILGSGHGGIFLHGHLHQWHSDFSTGRHSKEISLVLVLVWSFHVDTRHSGDVLGARWRAGRNLEGGAVPPRPSALPLFPDHQNVEAGGEIWICSPPIEKWYWSVDIAPFLCH